jgi:uncharacterized membrane protein
MNKRQAVHVMFGVAVALKMVNGVLEIVSGWFLVFKPGWIGPHIAAWTYALLHDPDNWLVRDAARWGAGLTTSTEHFASTYLIAHGVAKLFLGWGLIREKLWAFPAALAVFGLLILYQLYRLQHTHSTTLSVLIVVDVGVCYLIWREYGFRRAEAAAPASSG